MRLFVHFSVTIFTNTYLVGPDEGGDAILIDPGMMDIQLLKLIEGGSYRIRSILLTHANQDRLHGVKTLLKIYDAELYSNRPRIYDCDCHKLSDGDLLSLSGLNVEAMDVSGRAGDSLVYRMGDLLFTGDLLGAGRVAKSLNRYARSLLVSSIRERVLTLGDRIAILPAYGPPTTVGVERATNPLFNETHGGQSRQEGA